MKNILKAASLALLLLSPVFSTHAIAAEAEQRVIKLGIDPTFPPFQSKTPEGGYVGFGVEIVGALCEEMKVKCEWVESSWDGMIPSLLARKFDAIASSMFITEKRQKQIAFTNPISNSPSSLVGKKGIEYGKTAADMKGKKIGVEQGSAQETYAKEIWQANGIEVVPYQNTDLLISDLTGGRVDLVFMSVLTADEKFLKVPAGADYALAGALISDQKYFGAGDGIGLRKEDTDLLEMFNKALATIDSNGKFKTINDKYFKVDIRAK